MKFLHVRQNRSMKKIIPLFGTEVDRFASVPIIINNNVNSVQYSISHISHINNITFR